MDNQGTVGAEQQQNGQMNYNTVNQQWNVLPVRQIGFIEAIGNFFKNYVDFSGRATRSEYWFAQLFYYIVAILLVGVSEILPMLDIVFGIFALATIIPMFSLTFRRCHDSGKSGAWVLIRMVPFVGSIVMFVFMCLDSDLDNKYGPRIV